MNIFATSEDPVLSARFLDNRRLVKMVSETAQLLSTAVRERGLKPPHGKIYKTTHRMHPCAVWARETQGNFIWLFQHGVALSVEFRLRFGKQHKSLDVILECAKHLDLIPLGERTPFPNCTDFKDDPVHLAYMKQLSTKWMVEAQKGINTRFGELGAPPYYALAKALPQVSGVEAPAA